MRTKNLVKSNCDSYIYTYIYAISIFYITKCGMARTFSLILIITSYLNSQMGFAAWQLNILLSLED